MKFFHLTILLGVSLLTACNGAKVTEFGTASDELRGFQSTVYKLAREQTCVACHAKTQSPFFASADPQLAYESLMSAKKVNFQKPELSRLYQRLYTDHHNCWYGGDCAASAKEMLDAIYKWRESVKDYGVSLGTLTEEKPFLEGGKPPLPSGGFLFEAEDLKVVASPTSATGNVLQVGKDSAANKGKYLYVPERGRTTLSSALQDFTNYSYVEMHFTPTSPSYRFFGRVAGNGRTNDGFFKVKLNNNPARAYGATLRTDGRWVWQEIGVSGALNVNQDNVLTLGELDDAPKIDMIVMAPASAFSAMGTGLVASEDFLNRMTGRKTTLSYDLKNFFNTDGITLKVDISVFDESGYFLENAHIEDYNKNIRVAGVRVVQNGLFNPQDSDWLMISKVLITKLGYDELDPERKANTSQADNCSWDKYNYLSCNPMLIQRQVGPAVDRFSFGFETLAFTQNVPSLDDLPITLSDETNAMNLIQRLCINCHANLDANNQTHYVVTKAFGNPLGDPNLLDIAKTAQLLKEGSVYLNGLTIESKAYDSGTFWERVVRPRVLDGSGNVLPGSGGENSILYRILKYGEGPEMGRIPAQMEPFREAILTDPVKGPVLLASIKNWIDGLPPVDDHTPPKIKRIDVDNDDVGGTDGAKVTVTAVDDLTRVHVNLFIDESSSPVRIDTDSPREFMIGYDWPEAGQTVDGTVSHKFRAMAVDEVGNASTSGPTMTIAGCTLSTSINPGIGNVALATTYQATASASNRFASPSQTTSLDLKQGMAVLASAQASGTGMAAVNNFNFSFSSARNQAISIDVMNDDKVDAYSCSKEVNFASTVAIQANGTPTLGQAGTITVTFTSPFIVNVSNIELLRTGPNDPTPHPLSTTFSSTSTAGTTVSATFSWTPTDREQQAFRAIVTVDDGQATQFTTASKITAQ